MPDSGGFIPVSWLAGLVYEPEPASVRRPVRRGELCPRCAAALLDYNGLLDLECPQCGYTEGSGAGCT